MGILDISGDLKLAAIVRKIFFDSIGERKFSLETQDGIVQYNVQPNDDSFSYHAVEDEKGILVIEVAQNKGGCKYSRGYLVNVYRANLGALSAEYLATLPCIDSNQMIAQANATAFAGKVKHSQTPGLELFAPGVIRSVE